MNKKLFSWKALAGLALLVAMGLTSCKQSTEVDPNDPYNTQKPTQPGTSTKGSADLTFTIKEAGDLTKLWNDWQKNNADAAKKLKEKTTINIDVNFKDYEIVKGQTIVIPNFFDKVANSTLNISFNGNFKNADKEDLYLNSSLNLPGALVNVKLPAQTFNLHYDCAGLRSVLTSDGATIGQLFTNADANKNNALSINSGVTVKGIDDTVTGAILVNGGSIEALIINSSKSMRTDKNPTGEIVSKKGFQIGNQDVYTNNIIVNAALLTVTNDKDTPIGDIIINKNCDLKLGFDEAKYNSVTGTKSSESTLKIMTANLNGNAYKNVTVVNTLGWVMVTKDVFDGVKLPNFVNLLASSLSNVECGGDINIFFDGSNKTFALSNVAIPNGFDVSVDGGIEVKITPTKTTYQWNIKTEKWEVVGADGIYAANASDSGIEVSSNDVSFWNSDKGVFDYSKIQKGADKVGDHKVFTIVSENTNYLQPENCSVTLDSKCTYNGAAIIDNNINNAVTYSGTLEPTWFNVKVGNDTYTWKKGTWGWILAK